MKEKTTNPKRVKGTVLFTVVAVMMVLIVFLAGTLALAVTANKRAYTNYQQKQTEATARGVLDAVVTQINKDTTNTGLKKDIANLKLTDSKIPVTVDGRTYDVLVSKTAESRSLYNTTTKAWETVPLYKLEVTVDSATTAASTTYSAILGADLIKGGDDGSHEETGGGSGAFVAIGDLGGGDSYGISTHGYTTGGSFINIADEVPSKSVFNMQNGVVIEAPFYLNGSMTIGGGDTFKVHFTKPEDYMIITGNLTPTNNGQLADFTGYTEHDTYEKTPYIYVGGTFTSNMNKLGTTDHPVILYCTGYSVSNGFEMCGDMYLFSDSGAFIDLGTAAVSKLDQWTKSAITSSTFGTTQYGNMYIKGDGVFFKDGTQTLTIGGNLQCAGDLELQNAAVTNDVVCAGTLTVNGKLTCKNIYAANIVNKGTIVCEKAIKYGHYEGNEPTKGTKEELAGVVESAKRVWYTDFKCEGSFTPGPVDKPWEKGKYVWTASAIKHVKMNGTETTGTVIMGSSIVYRDSEADAVALLDEGTSWEVSLYKRALDYYNAAPHSEADAPEVTNYSIDADKLYSKPVYPDNATKTALDKKIQHPKATDYTEGITYQISSLGTDIGTAKEDDDGNIVEQYYADTATIYTGAVWSWDTSDPPVKVPGTTLSFTNEDGDAPTTIAIDGDTSVNKGDYYSITKDCIISGKLSKNIYVDTEKTNVLVLDNVYLDDYHGIILSGNGNGVILYIVGHCIIGAGSGGGNGGSIITEKFLDELYPGWTKGSSLNGIAKKSSTMELKQVEPDTTADKFPNVLIYSEKNATLEVGMAGTVTAMVRAPYMTYKQGKNESVETTIKYILPTGESVNYGKNSTVGAANAGKSIAVIGQLIANKIEVDSNGNWGMLYVTDGKTKTPKTCSCGCEYCTGDIKTCTCADDGCECEDCICDCHKTEETGFATSGGSKDITRFDILYYNVY